MFAEVILSRRFPKSMGIFDYRVPDALSTKLTIGHLVSLPFRSQIGEGVVVGIKKIPIQGKTIKNIISIIDEHPVLTGEQVALATWMSAYYAVSTGTIIKIMIPDVPKRPSSLKPILWPEEHLFQNIGVIESKKTQLIWVHEKKQKQEWFASLFSTRGKQTLILVSEIGMLDYFKPLIPVSLRSRTVFMHSKLTVSEMYDAWKKVRSGQALIILGTKIATLMPFLKLGGIVVDNEQDDDHKQYDQNPRFDVRTVSQELSKLYTCPLWFVTPSPTINSYNCVSERMFDVLRLTAKRKHPVTIVDMTEERSKKNFTLLSDALHDRMQETISVNKRVFLFLNRRGEANAVVCRDCLTLLSCKTCQRPLAVHTQKKRTELVCHYCGDRHELVRCEKCSSIEFHYVGGGTQRLEREVQKAFPQIKVTRIDADSPDEADNALVVIGTELGRKRVALDTFGCVGIVSADSLFHLPDFRSSERTYHRVWELISETAPDANIILQTYSPSHVVFRSIKNEDPELFYAHELTERKALEYPPFCFLIKLIFSHSNEQLVERQTMILLNTLKKSVNAFTLKPFQQKRGKKFYSYIICKLATVLSQEEWQKITSIIPDDWIIDRDPVSLL